MGERNLTAANELLERINACAERLSDHPLMFRSGRKDGIREALVHPNYVLVYRVRSDAVEILSVLHTRREYPTDDPE